jgi:predicted aspartyl protease
MPGLAAALALFLATSELPAASAASVLPGTVDIEIIKTRTDIDRRMTVPVRIGEQGTFHFVIDTGSQTTVLSTALARQLSLPHARTARIVGIGGTGTVSTAIVEELALGKRSLYALEVALLEAEHIGADGIVGIDSLQKQRVLLDFHRNTLAVGDAKSLGGNRGFEIVVTARRRLGQLIMTNAVIDGVRTDVIIDSGADTSIGNRALQTALSRRKTNETAQLISVTGQRITADIGYPRKLEIGAIGITNLLVAYADTPVFPVLGLERKPALLLGMRELRLFKRVAIDFEKRKVYFDAPE